MDFLSIKFFHFCYNIIFFGLVVLAIINPLTSSMLQFYEKTKSKYARDIDHLVSFNKNGLWIKEKLDNQERIITATKQENMDILEVEIYQFDKNFH